MAITLNGTTGVTTTGLTSNGIDDNATSTAMTLDSSGNVLVGKTSIGLSTTGIDLRSTGLLQAIRNGGTVVELNRQTSDGTIIDFRKDNTTVGSIGTTGGQLSVGNADTGLLFNAASESIYPWNTSTGAIRDAAIDLGKSNDRFKDLYLSGGVYLGGTGAANKLDDYEVGTWTPVVRGGTTAGTFSAGTVQARYVIIGEMVTLLCYIDGCNLSGASGGVEITGNPFTSATTIAANASAVGRHNSVTLSSNATTLNAVNVNGNTILTIRQSFNNGTGASIIDVSQLGSNFGLVFTLTFRAA